MHVHSHPAGRTRLRRWCLAFLSLSQSAASEANLEGEGWGWGKPWEKKRPRERARVADHALSRLTNCPPRPNSPVASPFTCLSFPLAWAKLNAERLSGHRQNLLLLCPCAGRAKLSGKRSFWRWAQSESQFTERKQNKHRNVQS